jgi:hypothetical protein
MFIPKLSSLAIFMTVATYLDVASAFFAITGTTFKARLHPNLTN